MAFITFANQSGDVPTSELDSNFAQCAFAADLAALEADVADLPSSATPLGPTPGGAPGSSDTLSKSDHQHPPQGNLINLQTGTTYTLQTTDHGRIVELSNAGAIAVTVPATLGVEFNCLLVQASTGQVTISPGSGATQRAFGSLTKTAGQWAEISLYVRANPGGSAAEYVLGGTMA